MTDNRIILGTAQLGLKYGINNKTGKPSIDASVEILNAAFDNGVRYLDTAEAYGNAQEIIGTFHKKFGKKFKIITKLNQALSCPKIIKKHYPLLPRYSVFLLTVFYICSLLNGKPVETIKYFFDDSLLLEYEIKHGIVFNSHNIFYGIWLKNYFSGLSENVNVIYQDEFYEGGRIISKALQPYENIKTISLQHGIFDLQHTVYGISELELSDQNGDPVPTPCYFIVWGEFFKEYFLSNNLFNKNRIMVLGNLKYQKTKILKLPVKQNIKKVLWCTGSPELTGNDMAFIENAILNNKELEVTIREHPIYKYEKELQSQLKLFDRFPGIKVSKIPGILEDIALHDLVVVNCYTTAFLDACLNGKYCLRIFPYPSYPSYLKKYNSSLIFNIFSDEDVYLALQQMKGSEIIADAEGENKDIMNINIPAWEQILTMNVA